MDLPGAPLLSEVGTQNSEQIRSWVAASRGEQVILLPDREEDGYGIYPQESVVAVKWLRREGVAASFAHPRELRRFEVKKSAFTDAVINFAVTVAANTISLPIQAMFARVWPNKKLRVRFVDTRTAAGHLLAVECEGDSASVLAALEQIGKGAARSIEDSRVTDSFTQVERTREASGQTQPLEDATPHQRAMYLSRLAEGEEMTQAARSALAEPSQDLADAERLARDGLQRFAWSLDWAESTTLEAQAHARLDEAGKWVAATFGCLVARDGKTYSQTCPVALAHNRIGLSVGGTAERCCSLCGEDLSECEHLPGVTYQVPGGRPEGLDWCRVCALEACDHSPDEIYPAQVVSIIVSMKLEEVSLVGRPAQPEARLQSITLDTRDLVAQLGEAFIPGMDIKCERCLLACEGLNRPFGG
ncbi:MAG: hypothetical protein ACYC3W_08925 [Candidatus Nanopelagicales bacterium]